MSEKDEKKEVNVNANCGCPDKVGQLLQTDHFQEEDREWLGALPNNQLDKLIALSEPETEKEKKEEANPPQTDSAPQAMSEEQLLQTLSPERRQQMEYGLKLYRQHREELTNQIMSNTDVYSKAELEALNDEHLEKLAKVIRPKADYSVMGNSGVQDNASEDVLLPPGVSTEK